MAQWFDNDDFLIRRLISGDEKALEYLFRENYTALKGAAYRIVGDTEQAQDVVQEVFANLWEKRNQLQISKPVKAYLFRAVINRSLNAVRDYPKSQAVSLESLRPEQHATSQEESSARLEEKELQVLVRSIIQQLPPQCKLAFQLSRDEEMSYKEIADHMGISDKAVEKHISRALKRLRDGLQAYLKRLLLLSW